MSIVVYKGFKLPENEPVGAGGLALYDNFVQSADHLESLSLSVSAMSGSFVQTSVFIGTVVDYVGSTVPPGYLELDGSEVNKTTYALLYVLVGDGYGTPGDPENFVLPTVPSELDGLNNKIIKY